MKPYYSCNYGELYFGDCMEILPSISTKVNTVVTSPPYFDKRIRCYQGPGDIKYNEWLCAIFREIRKVIGDDSSVFINIKECVKNGVRDPYVMELVLQMIREQWRYTEEFIWNKTNPFPTGSKKRLKDSFERIFQFNVNSNYRFYPEHVLEKSTSKFLESEKRRKNKKGSKVTNGSGMDMSRRFVSDMVRPGNVIQSTTSNSNLNHPAVFPKNLPTFFIKLTTTQDDTILDPFAGSSTTAIACIDTHRKFIMIEKEEKYCDLSARRIEEHLNKINNLDIKTIIKESEKKQDCFF